ncbi:MAG: FAD-binding oxidoreductase [Burkholderiales bacterium]|nr:FAD-binding oxidoreductase [Burkholderiales bacterium]
MDQVEVAVIGAGSVGIAVAYYLVVERGRRRVALIDCRPAMSFTSARSGENYRNWWPHPVMTAFTDHSISLMEQIDRASGSRLDMTRGGYALASRRERPEDLISSLYRGYDGAPGQVRLHESAAAEYRPSQRGPWADAPDGVDVLLNRALIRRNFPSFARDVASVIHIRRAGSFSAQQLGQFMLEALAEAGVRVRRAEVRAIAAAPAFDIEMTSEGGAQRVTAERIVNAAGPFVRDIGAMLGEDLPVRCVYQQKISFEDRSGAIPRDMPFAIDLDGQHLAWNDEERELLAGDPAARRLLEPMPGGVHCRPDGRVDGTRIKLGWAYNAQASDPHAEEPLDPNFPDVVLRAASRLYPALAAYVGRLPRGLHHYGGYYAMTEENWPLIGPMRTTGAFLAGALSGFGSMAACAAGSVCASWAAGSPVPDYAKALSGARHADAALMAELAQLGKGSL